MNDKIDFVVTWVDGSDSKWIEKKRNYTSVDDSSAFYRDYDTLKYWFRMVEKNADWVNKIFLITDEQLPNWLNINNDKLVILDHKDYIPKQYLPTFNSNVIELNLNKIEELSENFVIFNDDTFIINKINKRDYFVDNKPVLYGIYNALPPVEPFIRTLYNNVEIINKHFKNREALRKYPFKFFNYKYGFQNIRNLILLPWKRSGYINMHLPSPLKKSTLDLLWELEFDRLDNSCMNKVRNYYYEINHYIVNYWNIEIGNFVPASINFGKNILINDVDKVDNILNSKKIKILCINDKDNIEDKYYKILKEKFENKFFEKSKFEL